MAITAITPFEKSLTTRLPQRMAQLERLLHNSPTKDPAIAEEVRRRGFDWSNVLIGRAESGSFEMACSEELERATGQLSGSHAQSSAYAAYRMPFESLYRDSSDYVVGASNVTGANLVEQEVVTSDPVLALRPVSAFLGAGAAVIETVHNNVAIPRVYQVPGAGSGEIQSISAVSGFTSEQVVLNGQYYASQILISKQVLAQAADRKIQDYVVGLLRTSISKLIDNLALNGSGATNGNNQKLQILGLLNWPVNSAGVFDPGALCPSVAFGGTPTQANIAQAVYNLDAANYEDTEDARTWLISPSTRQVWSTTPLISGQSAAFLFDWKTKRVGPYKSVTTNQLSQTNQVVLVDMREPVFLLVAGFEIVVDNASYAASNDCLITCGIVADFNMFRGGASISSNAANGYGYQTLIYAQHQHTTRIEVERR